MAATYSSNGSRQLDTVPDSRGATINVHYSLSLLPESGSPAAADDRVGYFPTVLKDYSRSGDEERFVRYVNRWDLRKADPLAELSPPKRPIIFWLEKTIPFECRKPIREGILEWNKAFEKIGLANAIEVRQQLDDAEWDPEDVNYNTFRWITSSRLRHGPQPREPDHRRDPRRRRDLRRRLPAVLAVAVRGWPFRRRVPGAARLAGPTPGG